MSSQKEQETSLLLTRINSNLETLDSETIPKLQEHIFAGVFMPVFAGEENKYGATLETWVNFAGGPYSSVDVIDRNGVVIFRVPPIFDRSTINSAPEKSLNVSHIVATAQQYYRFHPNQGAAYLTGALDKCASILKVPANITKNLDFWNMVFKRYGRPEIVSDVVKEEVNLPKTNPDDFESF